MTTPIQLDMYEPTIYQQFLAWLDTPFGREVANRFIRIAWGVRVRGKRIGAKAIWERLRWHYIFRDDDGAGTYKLNNNYTAYMARLAVDKDPRLESVFHMRDLRNGTDWHPRRALLVYLNPSSESRK